MKFILIDKVVGLTRGRQIKAVKGLSLAEEYLGDHFPAFPVLPGVLLLQGMVESASWLVREEQDFANSMILLQQARNVKYKSFLAPGAQIEYTVMARNVDDKESSFTGVGTVDDERIVEAKIALRHFNLSDRRPDMSNIDAAIIASMRKRWKLLYTDAETNGPSSA